MNIRLFVANLLALIIIMSMSGCSTTKSTQKILGHENLIIYYDPQGGNGELIEAAKKYGSDVLYVYKNINGIAVTVPDGKTIQEATKYYDCIKGVLSVVEDRKMQIY